MSVLPKSVQKVIDAFERLPGVGPKSAARMAYFFLRAPESRSRDLARALVELKQQVKTCSMCHNSADTDPCSICSDQTRDHAKICVVEELLDVVALEKSGVFHGVYFVLGGVISPADGIGPEQIRIKELSERLKKEVEEREGGFEIIVATNPSLEGEATASYIVEMAKKVFGSSISDKVKISRLAMGLPTGADLEYADRLTLKRALEGRTDLG